MKMKLKDFPELVAELKAISDLAQGAPVDVDSPEIKNTTFYKKIHKVTELDASQIKIGLNSQGLLLLVAQIAATSPTLKIVNMKGNYLGEESLKVAEALAKSHSIHTIDITTNNFVGKYIAGVAAAFVTSPSIHKVNMDCIGLSPYAVSNGAIATGRASSPHEMESTLDRHYQDVYKFKLAASIVFANHNLYGSCLPALLHKHDVLPISALLVDLVGEYVGHHFIEFNIGD